MFPIEPQILFRERPFGSEPLHPSQTPTFISLARGQQTRTEYRRLPDCVCFLKYAVGKVTDLVSLLERHQSSDFSLQTSDGVPEKIDNS